MLIVDRMKSYTQVALQQVKILDHPDFQVLLLTVGEELMMSCLKHYLTWIPS